MIQSVKEKLQSLKIGGFLPMEQQTKISSSISDIGGMMHRVYYLVSSVTISIPNLLHLRVGAFYLLLSTILQRIGRFLVMEM